MNRPPTPAHDYWAVHVVPALEEWRANPTDVRRAMVAAVTLYHTADHYWGTHSVTDPPRVFGTSSQSQFRKELADREPDFALLRDVAEAQKHMTLNRSNRRVTDANQTDVGSMGFGEGPFGEGPYGGAPSVIIELDDGSKRHLSAVVEAVEKMWSARLP